MRLAQHKPNMSLANLHKNTYTMFTLKKTANTLKKELTIKKTKDKEMKNTPTQLGNSNTDLTQVCTTLFTKVLFKFNSSQH